MDGYNFENVKIIEGIIEELQKDEQNKRIHLLSQITSMISPIWAFSHVKIIEGIPTKDKLDVALMHTANSSHATYILEPLCQGWKNMLMNHLFRLKLELES